MVEVQNSKLEKLVKGQAKYQSANLGLNLLISRVQRKYAANKTSSVLESCVMEMKTFINKYSSIMTKDVEALNKL